MKTNIKWFCTILLFFCSYLNYGQGSDIIICIDNSGSVSDTEFNDMTTSINTIIHDVLDCNPENRVSVVHYGTKIIGDDIDFGNGNNLFPKIYIESDFTNNITTAQNFTRRLENADFLYESTQLIGNALDNIADTNIVSPQTQLNVNPLNNLIIFVFTDAGRGYSNTTLPSPGSYLVNSSNTTTSSNGAFQVFTDFKNNRGASFVVVHYPPNDISAAAGVSIASLGGNYNGPLIETYPADPDNNQFPRYYFDTTNFLLSANEITNITIDLCNISTPTPDPCDVDDLNINVFGNNLQWLDIATSYELEFYSDGECTTEPGTFLTANYTTTNSSFNIPQVTSIIGTKGFRFRIRTDCSDWSNWCCLAPLNAFAYTLTGDCIPSNPCDNYEDLIIITDDVLTGTTIEYLTYIDIEATNTIESGAISNYRASNSITLQPGFHAENGSLFHAYLDPCPEELNEAIRYSNDANNLPDRRNPDKKEANLNDKIKLYPNPTNNTLNISSTEDISYWELTNHFGRILNEEKINNKKRVQFNIQNLPTGIYFVKITLSNGEQIIKRAIKN